MARSTFYELSVENDSYKLNSFNGSENNLINLNTKEVLDFFNWIYPEDEKNLKQAFKSAIKKIAEGKIKHRIIDEDQNIAFVLNYFFVEIKTHNKCIIHGLLIPEENQCDLSKQNLKLTRQLDERKKEIDELSIALKTILRSIEQEKQALKDNISLYIESSILPILNEIKKKNVANTKIDVLRNNLKNLLNSQNKKLFLVQNGLTSKEIEICYQLVQGLKGKEVALNLDISYLTLRTHTKNIRKKLQLNRSQNLSLYLQEHLSGDYFPAPQF